MIAAAVALALLIGFLAVYGFPSQTTNATTSAATSTKVVTSSEVTTLVVTSTSVVTAESTVTQQVTSTTTIMTNTASTLTNTISTTHTVTTTTAPCAPLGPAVCGGVDILNASLVAMGTAPHSSQASAYLSLTAVNTGNVQITWLNVTLSGTPVFFASMTWAPGTSVTLSLPIPASEITVNQGQTYQLAVSTDTAFELVNVTAT